MQPKPGRLGGPILASCVVFLLGLIAILALVVSGGGTAESVLVTAGCGIGATILFALLAQTRSVNMLRAQFDWIKPRNTGPKVAYTPKTRRPQPTAFGNRRPPTAEDVKESRDSNRTWVPNRTNNSGPPRDFQRPIDRP